MQYTRSKVDFVISESMYMIPSDINLRIGKIKNYNNKILELKSYFKLGINKKINLDEEMGKPDVKPKAEEIVKTKPDVKKKRSLTSGPIKNTNKMSNLTLSSNMMLRNLIRIRSPMRKKRLL